MNKQQKVRDSILKMNQDIYKAKDKYFEKITKVIIQCVNNYSALTWDKGLQEVFELFIDSLTETYTITMRELRNIYSKLEDFNIDDISQLTYQEDGKTLYDRIKKYWDQAESDIKGELDYDLVKAYLIDRYDMLLENETKIIQSQVEKNKIAPVATLLVIESEGHDCRWGCSNYEGEYSPEDPVPLPPYHPNCQCIFYYVETDNDDDIVDLDLEIEDIKW